MGLSASGFTGLEDEQDGGRNMLRPYGVVRRVAGERGFRRSPGLRPLDSGFRRNDGEMSTEPCQGRAVLSTEQSL